MASRILHSGPSKSSAGDKRTQSALPRPSATKQISSSATPSSSAATSRLPTSAGSSLFGRSRAKGKESERTVERVVAPAAPVQSARPTAVEPAQAKKLAASRTRTSPEAPKSSRPPAAEVTRGLQAGMGVTTEITGGAAAGDRPVQPVRSLRRKASLTGAHEKYTSSEASVSEGGGDNRPMPSEEPTTSPGGHRDPFPGSIFGITVSPPSAAAATYTPISRPDYSTATEFQTSNSRMQLYMSGRTLPHKLSTQNLPPPTPNYTSTASAQEMSSASSRLTSTPSPFSRISTPNTSASSYSPAVPITPKLTPPRTRPSQSPTRSSRPPVSLLRSRKLPGSTPVEESSSRGGLPSVRETSTGNQSSSSSSNSTIKASEIMDSRTGRAVMRTPRIDSKSTPVTPLRLSSRKLPRPPLANVPSAKESDAGAVEASLHVVSEPRYQSRLPPARFSSGVRSPPPLRPSRQNTPNLPSLEQESPVIQSNLSHVATTGHTRRESLENAALMADRNETASPRRKLTKISPQNSATPASPHLYATQAPSEKRDVRGSLIATTRSSKRDPSPASTASTSSRSRFGIFSRKTKVPDEPLPSASRKGPSAGTGHEAYGKFGRPSRGRSGSQSSTGSRDKSVASSVSATSDRSSSAGRTSQRRKSSVVSNDGAQSHLNDDFLSQRLQPVVISGGGNIKNNRNSAIGGIPMYASSSAQSSDASFNSSYEGSYKQTGVTSSQSSTSMISTAPSDKRASRSLLPAPKLIPLQTTLERQRTLSHRTSQQRIALGSQAVRIPTPIDTQAATSKPVLDTNDTMQSSLIDTGSAMLTDELSESAWMKGDSKEQRKKSRSPRRWNLFSRNRSRSPKKSTPVSAAEPMPQLTPALVEDPRATANAADIQRAKLGGHYAMLDDEAEDDDARSMDNVLRDIEDELSLRDEEGAIVPGRMEEEAPAPRKVSMLLPSPPKLDAEFPRLYPTPARQPGAVRLEQALERKPSRLQRIGRIPTSHAHKPSQGSFSRPFQDDNRPSLEENRPSLEEQERQVQPSIERPRLALQTGRLPTTTAVEQWRQATYAPVPPTNAFLHKLDGEQEFLTIPAERQASQVTNSSTGTGTTAFMNMLTTRPSRDDEVWNEYDDILENEALFSLDSTEGEKMLSAFPVAPLTRSPDEKTDPARNSPPVPDKPDYLAIPPQLHPETNRLGAKNTLSDIYSDYNGRNNTSVQQEQEGTGSHAHLNPKRRSNASTLTESRYSSQTTISSSSHVSSYTPSPINSVTQAMARKTHSARDSLRFSALMTSRWLSFDRVLFSPVAEDILSLAIPTPRILVLDGLANDDWSAYTALSYPSATVYNLSTTPKLRALSPHGAEYSNPPNHKLLPLPSMAHPFPFPKGFFAAVALRFPPLLPQHHLANIIGEAKRVLRPGGFLEMTLLDIDPVNLGPKTRRQVKRVKVRAQERMPDAGLAPVADTAMKLLARRQFEGLRHAVLGVPVASTPDSNEIQGPGALPFNEERASNTLPGGGGDEGEDAELAPPPVPRSLSDLLREAGEDSAPGLAAQYPVAQTIGRVARWWWSRCYEGLASVDGNDERGTLLGLRGRGEADGRSMWADPEVMRECEEKETGLRLVLAYAVKPMVVRRRTASV